VPGLPTLISQGMAVRLTIGPAGCDRAERFAKSGDGM
jgi:hypothetical protein